VEQTAVPPRHRPLSPRTGTGTSFSMCRGCGGRASAPVVQPPGAFSASECPPPADVHAVSVKLGQVSIRPKCASSVLRDNVAQDALPSLWGRNGDGPPFSPRCHGCDAVGVSAAGEGAGRLHDGSGYPHRIAAPTHGLHRYLSLFPTAAKNRSRTHGKGRNLSSSPVIPPRCSTWNSAGKCDVCTFAGHSPVLGWGLLFRG